LISINEVIMNIKNVQGFISPLRNNLFNKIVLLSVTAALVVGGFFVFNTSTVFAEDPMTISTDLPASITVGSEIPFTVSTVANDDAGKIVLAHFTIPSGVSVTYLAPDGNYYPLTNVFGPASGFPVTTTTSSFKATFSTIGNETVTVDFQTLDGNSVAKQDLMTTVVAPADTTAPTAIAAISGNTITYTFSEPVQLVSQADGTTTPLSKDLLGIYAIDALGNYTNTKVGTIDTASLAGDVLTITYTGTLPAGNYVVDAWGYNIQDLAGNKIAKNDAKEVFTVAPTSDPVPTTPEWNTSVELNNNVTATGQESALTADLTIPTGGTAIQFASPTVVNPFNVALTSGTEIPFKLISTPNGVDMTAYYTALKGSALTTTSWGQYLISTLPGAASQTAMFYIKYDGANYTIADGTQNFVGTQSPMLIPGDFPAGIYTLTGKVNDTDLTVAFTITNENGWKDITPPTVTALTHNETATGGTITYTFSEPMQLTNNDGTAIDGTIASKLAVYAVTGSDYTTATKVPGITITDANLDSTKTVLTITYTGTLVDQINTKYVVDAWGYKIADLAGNKMLPSDSEMFTVTGVDTIAPTLNITGFTDNGTTSLSGSVATGYTLNTNNVVIANHVLQFSTDSNSTEALNGLVGLYLDPSSVDVAGLTSYYNKQIADSSYLTYLLGALDGHTHPFAYITTDTNNKLVLHDAAQYDAGNQNIGMVIPDNYPLGTYTINGTAKDTADNKTPITLKLIVAGDRIPPVINPVGFTASGVSMAGNLTDGFTLNTDNNPNTHYSIQFATGSVVSENLKDETVGLTLIPTGPDQTATLVSYYSTKPAEYQTYLDGAAAGTQPFAYIKTNGTTIQILDGAMKTLAGQETDMVVPGDYPLGTYTVSGVIHDLAGNPTTVTYKLIVAGDRVTPTATVAYSTTNPTNQDVVATITPSETVTGDLTHTFTDNGSFTFNFTDLAGNKGSVVATVSNIDKVAPVITLGSYTTTPTNQDITVTATTDKGTLNAISNTFTVNGSFNFVATDVSGNVTTKTVAISNIDKTAPVITLTGSNPQIIEVGAGYTELGATANDSSVVTIDASAFVNAVGSYAVTYNAVDAAGNAATPVTRTVNVVDTTAPVITISGTSPVTVAQGSVYTDAGATATDLVDGTVAVTSSGTVDTSKIGIYTITYTATDAAKNIATEVTRTVNVTDQTAPVITVTGTNPVTITQGSVYTDAGATATDNVDATVTVNSTGTVDTNTVGVYTITYSATDVAGNVATPVTRTVNVVAPVQTYSSGGGGGGGFIAPAVTPTPKIIPGCDARTTGFSTTTGQSCVGNIGTTVSTTPTAGQVLGAESFHFSLTLRKGATGDEVTQLQNFLNTAGYNVGTADGKFGAKTKAALIKFQIANKLKGDGVVGPKVRAILNK
jgi:hypothetical protein